MTTAEEHRKLTDSSKGGGGTVETRVRRARYMNAVRQTGNANLLTLMAHPRGVTIVDRFADDAQDGKEYAEEIIEECRVAIRELIGDLRADPLLIWRLPAAIGPGVWSLGGGSALTSFALAWGQTERSTFEQALDIAGNATLLLQLAGPVGIAIGDILDVVLAVAGTAVSYLEDLEQDRAALAGGFADESSKLSQGSRGFGTLLQGATAILAAVAVPGAVKQLIGRGAGAAARVEATLTETAARTERADARAVAGEITEAERGLARGARADAKPPAGAAKRAEAEALPAPTAGGPPNPGRPAQRAHPGQRRAGHGPAVELRRGLQDRLNGRIAELQEIAGPAHQGEGRAARATAREHQEAGRRPNRPSRARGPGPPDQAGEPARGHREHRQRRGPQPAGPEARNLLRGTEREYFDALSSAASRRETYRSVARIGRDEVFGLAGELDVEHIFPRSRMFLIPGFERLSWEQQVALFNYRGNLTLMSAPPTARAATSRMRRGPPRTGRCSPRTRSSSRAWPTGSGAWSPRSPRWSGTRRRSRSATASPIRSPHRCSARPPR